SEQFLPDADGDPGGSSPDRLVGNPARIVEYLSLDVRFVARRGEALNRSDTGRNCRKGGAAGSWVFPIAEVGWFRLLKPGFANSRKRFPSGHPEGERPAGVDRLDVAAPPQGVQPPQRCVTGDAHVVAHGPDLSHEDAGLSVGAQQEVQVEPNGV